MKETNQKGSQHGSLVPRVALACWLCAAALLPESIHGQTVQYAFTNFVGKPGGLGTVDGTGSGARFSHARGVAVDANGDVCVSDVGIRKITPQGVVTTVSDVSAAQGIAVDGAGNLFVADSYRHRIQKITPAGVVTTLAGNQSFKNEWGGIAGGFADGSAQAARFNGPSGVAVDGSGNVYVSEFRNHTIRKVTPAGVVTTLAGAAGLQGGDDGLGNGARFNGPSGLAIDRMGSLFVADTGNHTIRKITPAGVVTTFAGLAGQSGAEDGIGPAARFKAPNSLTVDNAGNVFVTDSGNSTIRRIAPDGIVTTIAGSDGQSGSVNGTGSAARFSSPNGIAADKAGNLYVAQWITIRRITSEGVVTTFAGSEGGGFADGNGRAARFSFFGFYEWGGSVEVDDGGNLVVLDTGNQKIRRVTPDGSVTTLEVSFGGDPMGVINSGAFYAPIGIAVDGGGNVYVTDTYHDAIRRISAEGLAETFAGHVSVSLMFGELADGYADGIGSAARFRHPRGVAVDRRGNLYVADTWNSVIRRITPDGVVTTLAGNPGQSGDADGKGSTAEFLSPWGIAVDEAGTVFVADGSSIRKLAPDGTVTTLAHGFGQLQGLAIDAEGNLFAADTANHTIQRVTASGVVTTIGGFAGNPGDSDGVGTAARFIYPSAVAVDDAGNLYVVDAGNNRITKGTPILVPEPRFSALSISGGTLTAQLTGLVDGGTVVLESSPNLRDWSPIQTNVAAGAAMSFSYPISSAPGAEYLRVTTK